MSFPDDFIAIIKKYDGSYPEPNGIIVNGNAEAVNNLVSFLEDDTSYIVSIFNDTEGLKEANLIPIAEDPFGNLFCYDFNDGKSDIVFWEHEDEDESEKTFICSNFTEFINMLQEIDEE